MFLKRAQRYTKISLIGDKKPDVTFVAETNGKKLEGIERELGL